MPLRAPLYGFDWRFRYSSTAIPMTTDRGMMSFGLCGSSRIPPISLDRHEHIPRGVADDFVEAEVRGFQGPVRLFE
jgi:hypothetical protein